MSKRPDGLPDLPFITALAAYSPADATEDRSLALSLDLAREPAAFERSNLSGHFTGSALVVDRARTKVLLTLHGKLDKWLHLGGHCDGLRDPFFVAWKEAYEESGLMHLQPVSQEIVDVDVHDIPEHRGVPAHSHYDIRYLFEADPEDPIKASDESRDLAWMPIREALRKNDDPGFLRLCLKALA